MLYYCIEGFPCGRCAYHFSEKVLKVELWGLHKIPSADLLNLLYYCIDSAELSPRRVPRLRSQGKPCLFTPKCACFFSRAAAEQDSEDL